MPFAFLRGRIVAACDDVNPGQAIVNPPDGPHRAVALAPAVAALKPPSLATLGMLTAVLSRLIAYEALRYAEDRDHIRHRLPASGS